MSDDKASDHASDTENAYEATAVSAPEKSAGETPKRGILRQVVLLCLLGMMVLALAYDYGIARPGVENAYAQVVQLNDTMNEKAESIPTLSKHIHELLKRGPTRTFVDGPYTVEVFCWTAGLPFRTHDLFAVYTVNGNDLVFKRVYMYQLPAGELTPPEHNPPEGDSELRHQEAIDMMKSGPGSDPRMENPEMGGRGMGGPGIGAPQTENTRRRPPSDSAGRDPAPDDGLGPDGEAIVPRTNPDADVPAAESTPDDSDASTASPSSATTDPGQPAAIKDGAPATGEPEQEG